VVQVAEVLLRWCVVGALELCSRACAIYLRCLMELCIVFPVGDAVLLWTDM
jgi:hypothetical protein